MPTYEYKCSTKIHPIISVKMSMNDDFKIKCPVCNKKMSKINSKFHGYVAGHGWLDKDGARRDMHKHTLQNDDPYGHMRQSGEVDDMIDRLNKAGRKDADKNENLIMHDGKLVTRAEREEILKSLQPVYSEIIYHICKSCKKMTPESEMNWSNCKICDPDVPKELSGDEIIIRSILGTNVNNPDSN